jgi:hypothetical protein
MFGGGGGFPGGMGGGGGVQIDPEMRMCSMISHPSFSLIILQSSICLAVQVAWVEVALVEEASPLHKEVAVETPSAAAAACREVVVAEDTSILAASLSKCTCSQKLDSIIATSCRALHVDTTDPILRILFRSLLYLALGITDASAS